MKRYLIAAGIAGILSLGVAGISQSKFRDPQSSLPKPLAGKRDPEGAMRQASQLMTAYKAANGDWSRVDRRLLFLPDQALVDEPSARKSNAFMPLEDPFYRGKVAFFAMTYVEKNLKYGGGDVVTSKPTGFVIVGYADGAVEKVPIEQVRYRYANRIRGSDSFEAWMYVFPKMPEYGLADTKPGIRTSDALEIQLPPKNGK